MLKNVNTQGEIQAVTSTAAAAGNIRYPDTRWMFSIKKCV
jgi:hypothetical protein